MNKLFYNPVPDLEGEIWKPIPDTNELYWASNLSRIKRQEVTKRGISKTQLLKPTLASSGSLTI